MTGAYAMVKGTKGTETDARQFDPRAIFVMSALLVLSLAVIFYLPRQFAAPLFTQIFLLVVIVLGSIDLLYLRIPNLLIYPALAFNLIAITLIDITSLNDAAIGTTALLGIMFLIALVGGTALGMGDVKFASFLGSALGWKLGILASVIGLVLGTVVAVALLYFGFRSRKDVVPLAPFLAAGAVITVLLKGTLLAGIFTV